MYIVLFLVYKRMIYMDFFILILYFFNSGLEKSFHCMKSVSFLFTD